MEGRIFMSQKFAILRTAKIKDWHQFSRLLDHAERTAEKYPKNAKKHLGHLNRHCFPEATGPAAARDRWKARVGAQHIRKNAVHAVELLLGMSPEVKMSPQQVAAWSQTTLAWVQQKFGKENIIGGSLNHDEKTPHWHVFVVPVDPRGKLNCRHFLGGGKLLSEMQSSYAKAVEAHGLERGIKGSKRTHIPQRVLYEFRNDLDRKAEEAKECLHRQIELARQIELSDTLEKRRRIADEIADHNRVLAKNYLLMVRLAKEVLLARRDAEERRKLFTERDEARKRAELAEIQAKDQKVKADEVLKLRAGQVREISLVEVAKNILGTEPKIQGEKTVFHTPDFQLEIEGRKFQSLTDSQQRGSGAIDLVKMLTGRDFSGAINYLETTHSRADVMEHDFGPSYRRLEAVPVQPKPLIFSDLPAKTREPSYPKMALVMHHLETDYNIPHDTSDVWLRSGKFWATADARVALMLTPFGSAERTGIACVSLDAAPVSSRYVLPGKEAYFQVGPAFGKCTRIATVADPLEALCYDEKLRLENAQKEPEERTQTMIVCTDSVWPPQPLLERIIAAGKTWVWASRPPVEAELNDRYPGLNWSGSLAVDFPDSTWRDHLRELRVERPKQQDRIR